jgi:hypothetical protein
MTPNKLNPSIEMQDVETGTLVTVRLSPGANGLMLYCYQGEQTRGEPMASLQIAPYQNQLEILYWDATMSNEQDPKHLVLVERIQHEASKGARTEHKSKDNLVEEQGAHVMAHIYHVELSGTQAVYQCVTVTSAIELSARHIEALAIEKARDDEWEAGDLEPLIDVDEIKEGERSIELDG